jgi:catechol 2,3-dioxygenase-like lactoylglutathione lyase family enzyme
MSGNPTTGSAPRRSGPSVFRILVAAMDLEESRKFYETLLGVRGRRVAEGRIYFDCGPVILGVLDYSKREGYPWSTPTESIYFSVDHIEEIYERATELRCLEPGLLHEDPASPLGSLLVRPWGERSFYAHDPAGNPLCFVDSQTLFTGTPRQIAALKRNVERA